MVALVGIPCLLACTSSHLPLLTVDRTCWMASHHLHSHKGSYASRTSILAAQGPLRIRPQASCLKWHLLGYAAFALYIHILPRIRPGRVADISEMGITTVLSMLLVHNQAVPTHGRAIMHKMTYGCNNTLKTCDQLFCENRSGRRSLRSSLASRSLVILLLVCMFSSNVQSKLVIREPVPVCFGINIEC